MSQADPASRAGASAAPSPLDCLAGGGEMGALMRSFDWTRTKLGPVASWPQSLRTAVSIMLDSAFGMVVAWGPEFIFLYNDRYRPVLGATKHPSAMGKRTCDVFPEVWDFVGPLFEKTRRGESVALDDVLLPLDRNGYLENCYFTLSYSPIRDESGGVGGMLAVVAETTQRVEGERRLRTLRNLAALAEARSADEACVHAEAVLSANRDDVPFSLLYLLDTDGRRARLAGVTGLGRDADAAPAVVALDGDDAWQLGVCNRTRQAVVLTDLASRFGPMPGGPCEEPAHTAMVLPMVRAGHDRLHGFFVAGVSPRRALDERYRTFFELGRDHIVAAIANALAYEEERQRAEALAAIDRAKTAFFSNVSHEFRTPLTLMLGPTEDALGSPERALGGESLETVHRNELRLLKLVNTLLDFSRIEAGRVQARFEPTDLGAVTSDLASAFRSAVERAGLRYEVECDRIEEPIHVDHGMWEKIVLNLLSNAFKFTFEGGIRVALRGDGDGVELSVADSGVGIPGEALPHVFERFRRVEGTRSRTHEGSGIGLALVHDLVKLHGGHVRVTSEVDRGTTFAVRIPKGKTHL
ncbi:MAG TPA: ATP-binding protein, partial [Polyangiaceae bacterium]|nr:ATP-binding protein [Polyangiaceae bacterium]